MKKDENLDKPKSLWRKIMDTPLSSVGLGGVFGDSVEFNNPLSKRISWSRVVKHMTIMVIAIVIVIAILIIRAGFRIVSSVATSVTPTMNTTTTALATPLSFFNSPLVWIIIFTPTIYIIWSGFRRGLNSD
jgi:hypothetical protein